MNALVLEKFSDVGDVKPVSASAVAQVVRVQLAHAHNGTHKTKTRSEVHGTGKKIYKQKGTGNARHGDRLAPQFRSGGIAHGPVVRTSSLRVNKKTSARVRQTLTAAVASQGALFVLRGAEANMTPSTSSFVRLLRSNGIESAVLVTDNDALRRSARNVPSIDVCMGGVPDAVSILRRRCIIVDESTLAVFQQRCTAAV